MAFSLNKIFLIGNLGRDAETRYTNNNLAITNFTVATTYGYKGKDGNYVNETTWHNVTGFSLSEHALKNLKKGKKVHIEGRLTKREYTDKDGNKRQSVDIMLESLIPLESTPSGSQDQEEQYTGNGSLDQTDNDDLPF